MVNIGAGSNIQSSDSPLSFHCARSERGIQKLVKLRSSVMRSYQNWKIPTDWMLDSGMVYRVQYIVLFLRFKFTAILAGAQVLLSLVLQFTLVMWLRCRADLRFGVCSADKTGFNEAGYHVHEESDDRV